MEEKKSWWKKVASAIGNGIVEGAKQTGKAMSYVGDNIIHGGKCYMCLKPADCDITCGHILCKGCLKFYIESQGEAKADQIPCFICNKSIPFEFTKEFFKDNQDTIKNLEEEKVPAKKILKASLKPDLPKKDSSDIISSIPQPSIPSSNIKQPFKPINSQEIKEPADLPQNGEPILKPQIPIKDLSDKDSVKIKIDDPQSSNPNNLVPPSRQNITQVSKEASNSPPKLMPSNKFQPPSPPSLIPPTYNSLPPIKFQKEGEKPTLKNSQLLMDELSSSESESEASQELDL